MSDLFGFEVLKKWKIYKPVIFGSLILQAVVLLISNINLGSRSGTVMSLFMLLYTIMMGVMFCMPFLESIFSFNRDLSGKQAVLELSIPIVSWKKVMVKLVVSMACIIFFMVLAGVYIDSIILLVSDQNEMVGIVFKEILQIVKDSPGEFVLVIIYMLFFMASFLMVTFFCIALAKSISHKNRIAIPLGIGVFIAYFSVVGLISPLADKVPIIMLELYNSQYSLMSVLIGIALFMVAFGSTSWLMEKRIES